MSAEHEWQTAEILIRTRDGWRPVSGYLLYADEPLAVTPLQGKDAYAGADRYVITYVPNGMMLWPNYWPLEEARSICRELLSLGDWMDDPNALRAAAESVCRRHDRTLRRSIAS